MQDISVPEVGIEAVWYIILSGWSIQSLLGAPLGASLIQETYSGWKISVRQAYGLSETTSVSHIQHWDNWDKGIGSNGPAVPGVKAKIVIIFNSYMNDRPATRACLTPDRWFKTGDIGFEDEMGNLHTTDRSKDMVKFKGFQITPTELEDILLDHSAVSDAVIIGNEEMQTDVPLAYIAPKGNAVNSDNIAISIMEHLKGSVVHYEHLRGGFIWISQIPKSTSGKILKRAFIHRVVTVDKGSQVVAPEYARYRYLRL
ncbi:hypothetical protein BDW59DRAFT_166587 [Aspergillus cavernicola]|uniref:AMP-binding enzyme C-terminal domain-containing protein n=1 Tax=Aspergillus cavernicola TaxID=176166 RepID=A0ABR4HK39_9EURO